MNLRRLRLTSLLLVAMVLSLAGGVLPVPLAGATPSAYLVFNLTKVVDGHPPFDATTGLGNDSSATNDTVRIGDAIDYRFAPAVNDPSAPNQYPVDLRVEFDPLPLHFVYDRLPPSCDTPESSITGDGVTTQQVLVCVTKNMNTGGGPSIPLTIRPLRIAQDGETVQLNATFTATDSATQATIGAGTGPGTSIYKTTEPVVVTGILKMDISKYGMDYRGVTEVNGQTGYLYSSAIGLKYLKGSMAATEQSLTWVDDFSSYPAGTMLYACGGNYRTDPDGRSVVYGNYPLDAGPGSNYNDPYSWDYYGIKQPGTLNCTQSGTNINMAVSGIDTAPTHYPRYQPYGTCCPLPESEDWIGSYWVEFFVPDSAFATQKSFTVRNKLVNFNPTTPSGLTNFGDGSEIGLGMNVDEVNLTPSTTDDGRQNDYTGQIYEPGGGMTVEKYDLSTSSTSTYFTQPLPMSGSFTDQSAVTGALSRRYGYGGGALRNSSVYAGFSYSWANGVWDLPAGMMVCQTIDNSRVTPWKLPGQDASAYIWTYNPVPTDAHTGMVIEYGAGGIGGVGQTWASWQDQRSATCDNSDSPGGWYSTLSAVPGGPQNVTKVRWRTTRTYTAAEQRADASSTPDKQSIYFYLQNMLQVNADVPLGTVIPNFTRLYVPPAGAARYGYTGWGSTPSYDPTSAGYTGDRGDSVVVVGARVNIYKHETQWNTTALAGNVVPYELQPSIDNMNNPIGQATNVTVVDTLPAGLTYLSNSTTCIDASAAQPVSCEPSQVVNPDGTTTLTWLFGNQSINATLTRIRFNAQSETTIPNGSSLTNTTTISAGNDPTSAAYRTSTWTVSFSNRAGFATSKKALTPLVEPGEDLVYQLTNADTGDLTVNTTDTIDWLPFNTDGRVPATAYHGDYDLVSLTQSEGTQTTSFKYTSADPATVNFPADADPQTVNAAIVWCAEADFGSGGGCPASMADVTGFRILGGSMASGDVSRFVMVMRPRTGAQRDAVGDVFTNRFATFPDTLGITYISNNTPEYVVASSIGDRVWLDENGNGIQDAAEIGVGDVTVQLLNADGSPAHDVNGNVLITQTDSSGNYVFENLFRGDYRLKITTPSGYANTAQNVGTSDALDSDIDPATSISDVITLARGSADMTLDAGLYGADPSIALVKYINGDDANTAPGVGVAEGSQMDVTFLVTNTGNTTLNNVAVTDNVIPGDITCPATTLMVGATMTCSATWPAPAVGAQHTDRAVVVGSPLVPAGVAQPADVSAKDLANAYTLAEPSIVVVKKINGVDANTAPGVMVPSGSDMNVTFEVTNNGNVTLDPVTVTDDTIAAAGITCPKTRLTVGAAMTCTATAVAPKSGTHTNVATATGTPVKTPGNPDPKDVTDTDPANAWVPAPAISVVKRINGDDADKRPGVAVTYPSLMNVSFEVTNTGDVRLNPVTVTDDVIPASQIACPQSQLDVGESMTCNATWAAPYPGVQHSNNATATGVGPTFADGTPGVVVKATNPANAYSDAAPEIRVVKRINGDDANTSPGVEVGAGAPMTVTFEVTNTGNVRLDGVKVTDDVIDADKISCPRTTLLAGESMTCSATWTGPAADQVHWDTATVVGSPSTPKGDPLTDINGDAVSDVTDDDPAFATGVAGGLRLYKAINEDDANTPPGVIVTPGSQMKVWFAVVNTEKIRLTQIKVSDDMISANYITCPKDWLDGGDWMVCEATYPAPAAGVLHHNTGSVTAVPVTSDGSPAGPTLTATDPAYATGSNPAISVVKKINGFDANTAPGVSVFAGTQMDITFEVTNTGNTDLNSVALHDSVIPDAALACPQAALAVGESMTCQATYAAPAAGVQHTNLAAVSGVGVDSSGNPLIDPVTNKPFPPVTDEDPANAFGKAVDEPAITVVKSINGDDANTAPGVLVAEGSTMNVKFVVTNTGRVRLANITLTDDTAGSVTCPVTALNPGESTTCTTTMAAPAAGSQHTNVGTVTGTPVDANDKPLIDPRTQAAFADVTDTDPANAHSLPVLHPAVTIVKKINGDDANTAPGVLVAAGSTMIVDVEVTNTGDTALSPVKVTDNVLTNITCPKTKLAVGESMTCQGSLPAPAVGVQHTNVAAVAGTPVDANGDPAIDPTTGAPYTDVKADDPANAYAEAVLKPAISVIKKINGDDANTAPGVLVPAGSTMAITFDVKNTGDTVLDPVALSDSTVPTNQISCPKTRLVQGETMQCTATLAAPAPSVQHTNTATVTGRATDTNGVALIDPSTHQPYPTLTDDDPANAYSLPSKAPAVQLVKKINGDDADTAPGVLVAVGSTMKVTFEVTNTGDTKLDPVVVKDDQLTLISCPDTALDAGSSMTCEGSLPAPAAGIQHTNHATVTGTPVDSVTGNPVIDPTTGQPYGPVKDADPANAHSAPVLKPAISVVKKINGDDADTAPGVLVPADSTMKITFEVTNTGETALNNVTVTDDRVATSDITCPATSLAVGASMTCTASLAAPAVGAQHTDTAVATGKPVDGNGGPAIDPTTGQPYADPTSTNPANAHSLPSKAPAIQVVKKINGDDADTAPGVLVAVGSTMKVTFEVTNIGDTRLDPVVVKDDQLTQISCPDTALDAGRSMTCEGSLPAPAAGIQHTNHATATGTPVDSTGAPVVDPTTGQPYGPVKDADPANAHSAPVLKPAISVVKKINGDDANAAPGVLVPAGSTMKITFEVTNTGETALNNVTVTDDKVAASDISCPATSLAIGASMICTASLAAPAVGSQHTNVATATGSPVDGNGNPAIDPSTGSPYPDPTSTNPANAHSLPSKAPAIQVVKKINGDDADSAPGVLVAVGSTMKVTFEVTNIGDTTLDPVVVKDDQLTLISCPDTALDAGSSMTCEGSLPAPAAGIQHTNHATATGTPVDSAGDPVIDPATGKPYGPVKDGDPANAHSAPVLKPAISVVKKINGDDANTTPGVLVPEGSTMKITFEVSNTGETPLANVKVTDDKVATADISCPATSLAVGASMTCTASLAAPAAGAQHTNTATATGSAVDANGDPAIDPSTGKPYADPTATNPANAHSLPSKAPAVQLVKKINGDDADTAPGVLVAVGSTMKVTFEVTNIGDTKLDPVVVTDDHLPAISCPETALDAGAKMTCEGSLPAPAAGIQHTNHGSVSGTPVDSSTGDPVIDPATGKPYGPVKDADPANAHSAPVLKPAISVVKKINGDDANTAPGVVVPAGSTMNITFEVTNTGQTPLANVKVTDDKVAASDISCPFTTLAVGASMTCTATLAAPAVGTQHTDTASATGTPVDGNGDPGIDPSTGEPYPDPTSTNPANAHSLPSKAPAVQLVKKINGDDANTAPGVLVAVGSTMKVTFEVTNTGDTKLDPVVVTDDQLTAISCPETALDAGTSMTCQGSLPAPAAGIQHTNHAAVTGTPVDSTTGDPVIDPSTGKPYGPVTDADPANAHSAPVLKPAISVVKKINGDDADKAPGVLVPAGSTMKITFEVTNTGETPLANVKVTDDKVAAADITCPGTTLAVGASMTCTASLAAPAFDVQHTNTATATGTPVDGNGDPAIDPSTGEPYPDPTATNPANAHSAPTKAPAIQVVKKINGDDADAAPGVLVAVGSTMKVTFEVTNIGDTKLDPVVVTDDHLSAISCPQTSLDAGAKMTCEGSLPAPAAGIQHTNHATATGTPVDSSTGEPVTDPTTGKPYGPVKDGDPANAHSAPVLKPSISVIKKINGDDANTAPGVLVPAGSTMKITFVVTNTGDTPLADVTVTDNKVPAAAITCPATTLAVGASMTCTASLAAPKVGTQHTDTATATGTPVDGSGKPAIDPSTGKPYPKPDAHDDANAHSRPAKKAAIQIIKKINGLDADSKPGVKVAEGSTMQITFEVTNIGDTKLDPVVVKDDHLAKVSCPKTALDVGATMTCVGELPAPATGVQHTDTATATGTPTNDDGTPVIDPATGKPVAPVTDADSANAFGTSDSSALGEGTNRPGTSTVTSVTTVTTTKAPSQLALTTSTSNTSTSSNPLAHTGARIAGLLLAATLLTLVGFALTMTRRRKGK